MKGKKIKIIFEIKSDTYFGTIFLLKYDIYFMTERVIFRFNYDSQNILFGEDIQDTTSLNGEYTIRCEFHRFSIGWGWGTFQYYHKCPQLSYTTTSLAPKTSRRRLLNIHPRPHPQRGTGFPSFPKKTKFTCFQIFVFKLFAT